MIIKILFVPLTNRAKYFKYQLSQIVCHFSTIRVLKILNNNFKKIKLL